MIYSIHLNKCSVQFLEKSSKKSSKNHPFQFLSDLSENSEKDVQDLFSFKVKNK
jgi:hypothetical protein